MFRFFNFIVLIFAVCAYFIFFMINKDIRITQEVLDLFPQTNDKKVIDIYQQFSNSRNIFVAIKGFNKESHDILMSFLYEIDKIPNIKGSTTRTKPTQDLEDFLYSNYLYIATPNKLQNIFTQKQMKDKIANGLNTLKQQIDEEETLDSGIITNEKQTDNTNNIFHPSDPLGLFSLKLPKSYVFNINNYGYMALVEMKDISQIAVKDTLKEFKKIAVKYPQIRYFSQNFMNVENLDLILSEVTFLLTFSTIAFIVLYFLIIRIPMLTINTICTLAIANIIAMLIVSLTYEKVTIMALSFGMGISNIAIDYMMHHNFFNLYAQKSKVFNRPVFYGYITTIVGFIACLFVPFPLLSQLSLYAIISLSICYVSFAFIYPRIGFVSPRLFPKLGHLRHQSISSYWFIAIAICLFCFSFYHLKLDFDLSKLDYQNKPLLKEKSFFEISQGDKTQILLSSSSLDKLIALTKVLQDIIDSNSNKSNSKTFIPLSIMPTSEDIQRNEKFLESENFTANKKYFLKSLPSIKNDLLEELQQSKDVDNKEDKKEFLENLFEFFADSYKIDNFTMPTIKQLSDMGFTIIEHDEQGEKRFYYLTIIQNEDLDKIKTFALELNNGNVNVQNKNFNETNNILSKSYIELRSLQNIMDNLTNTIYKPMSIILGVALFLMICMLFVTAKGAFLDSLVFILFPLSSSLFVISSHSDLNIMHLFALLILVVVSIDYGIYSVKEGDNIKTIHAIFFSIITTGVSFGILIVSNTKAINSFGEVIFTGMICILFMLVFHKPIKNIK